MKLYKLTTCVNTTKNRTQWGENVTHTATGKGRELCTNGVIHAYVDPLLAVLMDPIHGEMGVSAHLWECDGDVVIDDGTKVGCKSLTTIKQVSLPAVTTEQRVRFAILCAKAVYTDSTWNSWAESWLNGTDRSIESADEAVKLADRATEFGVSSSRQERDAAKSAAWAARAARVSAWAWAARAARWALAARAAREAATLTPEGTLAAAAAYALGRAAVKISLSQIAHKAVEDCEVA